MFLQFLTLMDFLCAIIAGLSFLLPARYILLASLYLIFKGLYFGMMGKNIVSWLDFSCGIYMVFLAIGLSNSVITVIVVLYLIQKSLMVFLR